MRKQPAVVKMLPKNKKFKARKANLIYITRKSKYRYQLTREFDPGSG